jgi:integral membrane protein (TIGR01906 family)
MKWKIILFSVVAILFLVLFSFKMVLFLTPLSDNQQQTVDFLQGKEELKVPYEKNAVSHMDDVKKVFFYADVIFYLSLLIVTGMFTYYKKKQIDFLKFGGWTTILGLGSMLVFALVGFNTLFTWFHKIFFPQGNWMFDADSLLIQTFPIEFFVSMSVKIFILALVFGIVFIVVGKYMKHDFHNKRN